MDNNLLNDPSFLNHRNVINDLGVTIGSLVSANRAPNNTDVNFTEGTLWLDGISVYIFFNNQWNILGSSDPSIQLDIINTLSEDEIINRLRDKLDINAYTNTNIIKLIRTQGTLELSTINGIQVLFDSFESISSLNPVSVYNSVTEIGLDPTQIGSSESLNDLLDEKLNVSDYQPIDILNKLREGSGLSIDAFGTDLTDELDDKLLTDDFNQVNIKNLVLIEEIQINEVNGLQEAVDNAAGSLEPTDFTLVNQFNNVTNIVFRDSSGYYIFPNGLILQWGQVDVNGSVANNSNGIPIGRYPIPFPTAAIGGFSNGGGFDGHDQPNFDPSVPVIEEVIFNRTNIVVEDNRQEESDDGDDSGGSFDPTENRESYIAFGF